MRGRRGRRKGGGGERGVREFNEYIFCSGKSFFAAANPQPGIGGRWGKGRGGEEGVRRKKGKEKGEVGGGGREGAHPVEKKTQSLQKLLAR
jgi:hypothetical protein